MLFQQPKKALSTPAQVEQTSTVAKEQIKIHQEEDQALLKWITEGHLEEVEKLLKKNPGLGLCRGTVKDLSNRKFTNITALQYAAWSLDLEMCDLILGYLSTHNSAIQLKALYAEPGSYSPYGDHYDIKPLIAKTKKFVENYNKWDYAQCCQYWQKEVGREQRKCPAWLIYAWSEEGKDVAWTKQDFSRKVKREYDKHRLEWWFTENYDNGLGVGSTWGCARGYEWYEVGHRYHTRVYSYWLPTSGYRCCRDAKNLGMIENKCNERLVKLKVLSEFRVKKTSSSIPLKK
jgi:hypothetical protein